ncbi:MAG: endonuclease/exonuclease/phosphatase [Chloroflexi bacterium OLB14]|nr:MAG: endonuclease/exonuclease/phosphatase [Chloroflexi bacterium OLB14]
MPTYRNFSRFALVLILLISVCAGLVGIRVPVRAAPNFVPSTNVVISQVYGGGGNSGAPYTNDFVELFNLSTTNTVSLNGWSIQYASASGITWTLTNLSGSLLPGQYYLIQLASAGSNGSPLPTPDATGTTVMSASAGKVALVNSTTPLTGVGCPFDSSVIDFVGYGTTAGCYEGANYAPAPSNINADIRIANGCTDTDNNNTDFIATIPTPRNTNSMGFICGVGTYTPTLSPTSTNTPTITLTPTITFTPTNTPPFSPTPTLTPAPGEVVISEVAWMGTTASPNDEWIELYNPSASNIDLTGWRLITSDGDPDIIFNSSTCIPATCIIPAGGYFLLERAHDNVVQEISANLIFFGQLDDTGETLILRRGDGAQIDTANSDGDSWPAGTAATTFYSMERLINGSIVAADTASGWVSNNQPSSWVTHDAANNLIHGTPGLPNFNFISTLTPTSTPTITPTRTITPTSSVVRSVVINEIAWAGTASGLADDEWIELYNRTSSPIDISDWSIRAADGSPNIELNGIIPAGGYFLLEKDDDTTVSDILADQIYTGNTLSNSGEALTLYDASNKAIDTANGNGGSWPRGSSSTYGTMERILNTIDSDSAWVTNTGIKKNGKNANGGDILGTPKQSNTVGPTPTPTSNKTATPTRATLIPIDPRPIINEILARPGFDWNQDGKTNVYDEFIEIKNLTAIDITLNGWKLDKGVGSTSFSLPNITLKPNERIVFYSLETNLLLSDGGETIRLINSKGKIYDAYTYTLAKVEDQSFCRLPDGNVYNGWFDDCTPTPSLSNTRTGTIPQSPTDNESSACNLPDTIPNDFFFAECEGYGKNIWNPFYWDELFRMFIESNTSKWETYFE